MIGFEDICAVIVTRGDVEMSPILETLPYGDVIVYDNSVAHDWKIYGRYVGGDLTSAKYIYFQDDDVIFREHERLLDAYNETPDRIVGVMDAAWVAKGKYEDLCLVGAGSIVPNGLWKPAFADYLDHFPFDDLFLLECDFISGTICPHRRVDLPYEIRDVARRPDRLCKQPWQEEWKLTARERARSILNA